jgi:hypothetical protein
MIPEKWLKLASEPVNSPLWHSSKGEEYLYQADAAWMVVNEKIGPYRVRHICQIVKEIQVRPEGSTDG